MTGWLFLAVLVLGTVLVCLVEVFSERDTSDLDEFEKRITKNYEDLKRREGM